MTMVMRLGENLFYCETNDLLVLISVSGESNNQLMLSNMQRKIQ